ncbi:hypothetical protein HYY69_08275 [Candidatus Woesearchaeota archaeon]|nr:hypothetical protein [Candidatus Woesearchaeota archaeon]
MISAQLFTYLEKKGFSLDFPSYNTIEEPIIEILLENNSRILLALPLLLHEKFSYEIITKRLLSYSSGSLLLKQFHRIILITNKIFLSENIDNSLLKEIIDQHSIHEPFDDNEFQYYLSSFQEFQTNAKQEQEIIIKEQIAIRSKLQLNKALALLFAPAKLIIMQKIYSHETLTNTELKYYYKAIRPLIFAILQEDAQKYLKIIESIKKYKK